MTLQTVQRNVRSVDSAGPGLQAGPRWRGRLGDSPARALGGRQAGREGGKYNIFSTEL